jgi:hypothetical protein
MCSHRAPCTTFFRPVSELDSGSISLVEGRVVDVYAVHARTSALVIDNDAAGSCRCCILSLVIKTVESLATP